MDKIKPFFFCDTVISGLLEIYPQFSNWDVKRSRGEIMSVSTAVRSVTDRVVRACGAGML